MTNPVTATLSCSACARAVAVHALGASGAWRIAWARHAIPIDTAQALGARRVRAFLGGAIHANPVHTTLPLSAVAGRAFHARLTDPIDAAFTLVAGVPRAISRRASDAPAVHAAFFGVACSVWAGLRRTGLANPIHTALAVHAIADALVHPRRNLRTSLASPGGAGRGAVACNTLAIDAALGGRAAVRGTAPLVRIAADLPATALLGIAAAGRRVATANPGVGPNLTATTTAAHQRRVLIASPSSFIAKGSKDWP